MRFANDFQSWLRHSWKLLANRLTRDPKIVIHGNSCIILYIFVFNQAPAIYLKTKSTGVPFSKDWVWMTCSGRQGTRTQVSWRRHPMKIFSVLLALCKGNPLVTGGFPSKAGDAELWCFFDLSPNKWLSKQWRRRWFETPPRSLWRHCNGLPSDSTSSRHFKHWVTQTNTLWTDQLNHKISGISLLLRTWSALFLRHMDEWSSLGGVNLSSMP